MGLGGALGGLSLCSFGVAPMPISIIPKNMVMGPTGPLSNIMDNIPMLNVAPYVMCTLPPLPKPCVPALPAPWVAPIPTVLIANVPAFDNTAKGICAQAGVINILMPMQFNVLLG